MKCTDGIVKCEVGTMSLTKSKVFHIFCNHNDILTILLHRARQLIKHPIYYVDIMILTVVSKMHSNEAILIFL